MPLTAKPPSRPWRPTPPPAPRHCCRVGIDPARGPRDRHDGSTRPPAAADLFASVFAFRALASASSPSADECTSDSIAAHPECTCSRSAQRLDGLARQPVWCAVGHNGREFVGRLLNELRPLIRPTTCLEEQRLFPADTVSCATLNERRITEATRLDKGRRSLKLTG